MGRHRLPAPPRSKRGTAVRTGLLGVSAAVALGTAAVTTGVVPVGSAFPYVGQERGTGPKTEARSDRSPAQAQDFQQQGGLADLPGRAPARTSPPPAVHDHAVCPISVLPLNRLDRPMACPALLCSPTWLN